MDALVEAELVLEAGSESEAEASAAVVVFAPTVMREDVVEGVTDADVHDLVSSAVGRAAGVFEVREAEAETESRVLSSTA